MSTASGRRVHLKIGSIVVSAEHSRLVAVYGDHAEVVFARIELQTRQIGGDLGDPRRRGGDQVTGEVIADYVQNGEHFRVPEKKLQPCVAEFRRGRSEEHTSELQSQSNLVCRLLLEKK